MSYRPHGRATVDPSAPRAWGICDRCGFLYNLDELGDQAYWAGPTLLYKNIRICPKCTDVPQEQLRTIVLGPDPLPVYNPRPDPTSLFVDEGTWMDSLAAQTFDTDEAGWAGFTIRQQVRNFLLTRSGFPGTGTQVRLTLTAPAGGDVDFDSVYFQEAAVDGINPYSFVTTPFHLTVDGAYAFTIPAGTSVVTDAFDMVLNQMANYVLSAYVTSNDLRYESGVSGLETYLKAGDDASSIIALGYSGPTDDRLYIVSRVEVLQYGG